MLLQTPCNRTILAKHVRCCLSACRELRVSFMYVFDASRVSFCKAASLLLGGAAILTVIAVVAQNVVRLIAAHLCPAMPQSYSSRWVLSCRLLTAEASIRGAYRLSQPGFKSHSTQWRAVCSQCYLLVPKRWCDKFILVLRQGCTPDVVESAYSICCQPAC